MNIEQIVIMATAYLLGVAFAGSFIGRKWMGTVDIFLHRLFRIEVTMRQYFYWKYITGIADPPKPKAFKKVKGMEKLLLNLIMGTSE